jgi:ubiquinone biosynthesis protein
MLKQSQIPTRLIDPAARPPVIVLPPQLPSRYRGLRVLSAFGRLLLAIRWARLRRRYSAEDFAVRLRALLEQLGGAWIKVGQLLSLRVDLFPIEFCRELSKLQDQAFGFPAELARRTIEEELRGPLERVFDHFENHPFAAASIGQLHRAHLKHEQVWVAIKVQRPYIRQAVASELELVRRVVGLVEWLKIMPFMRWSEMLWELEQILQEEVDYRFEAASMRRMRKVLRRHKVYVPKVYSEYSSQRVLVMEFVTGVLMADYIKIFHSERDRLDPWCRANNVDPQKVAHRLAHSLLRQLFEDNLYHGDLHPGNIVLLRDNRVALIDFGSVGFTEKEYLEKFRLYIKAIASQDYAKAADLTLLLCAELSPSIDFEAVKEQLVRAMRGWAARTYVKDIPYHLKSVDHASVESARILTRFKVTPDWAFLRIRRAMSTLDASLMHLYPEANYPELTREYFKKAERRALRPLGRRRTLVQFLGNLAHANEIPQAYYEYQLFTNTIRRRQAQVFQGATSKLSHFFSVLCGRLAIGLLLAAFFNLLVFLHQHHPTWVAPIMRGLLLQTANSFPRLEAQVWWLILGLDFYFCYMFARLKQRFAEREARREAPAAV